MKNLCKNNFRCLGCSCTAGEQNARDHFARIQGRRSIMDFILHGYCGLYCGACPIMLNTKAGTGTEQCYGCKSEQPTGYCAVCGIKACARGKGYEFCNECSEYGTCERMQKFLKDANWPYQQIVSKNMESIRQNGLSKWLEAQEQRWRCTNCGAFHSWWDESCPQCGQAVTSYKADI